MQNNKKQTGVWIDNQKAIIAKFDADGLKISILESDINNAYFRDGEPLSGDFMGAQHLSAEKTVNEKKENYTRQFLKNVWSEISGAEEIYLIGPGDMRSRLANFVEKEHKKDADKIKGTDSCDYLKESQIIDRMKSFFKI